MISRSNSSAEDLDQKLISDGDENFEGSGNDANNFSGWTINADDVKPNQVTHTHHSYTAYTCWGAMQVIVMAVSSETFVEFTCPEKSLADALVLAFIVPLSMEWFKQAFNRSGTLKKDFTFDFPANATQIIVLMAVGFGIYYGNVGKNFSPLGYNACIIVPGIVLKLLAYYFEQSSHSEIAEFSPVPDLESGDRTPEQPASVHAGKWYNSLAMHGMARAPLLFSACNAGGEFFEAMHIPLAEGIEACGLTNFAAVIAFSVLLNEIIGSHLFKYSERFVGVAPNLISRTLTIVALPVILQAINGLQEENIVNFTAAFAIGFATDFAVQESTLGSKIDASGAKIGEFVQYRLAILLSKCGILPPPAMQEVQDQNAYNPLLG